VKTILVIEDEQPIRTNILKLLQFNGFQAVGAENGAVGVQMAIAHTPDLIICDIMMPEMDGYQVLDALHQKMGDRSIPFIFLSAKAERSEIRHGMNLGADDYLTKPFTSTELLEAIAARLDRQATLLQPYLDKMKQAANNLGQMAYIDPLTELPNRISFHHRLQNILTEAKQNQSLAAVLRLNVTNFRTINTTLGHPVGDALLKAIAQRLSGWVHTSEETVARFGNDEFCIVLSNFLKPEDCSERCQALLEVVTMPYTLENHTLSIQATLGCAVYPSHSPNLDQLLSYAEIARSGCYQTGKSYQLYTPELGNIDAERRAIAADLSYALDRAELHVLYQPQINLITGRVIGVEALLRWEHPQRGTLFPGTFIPIAEETGLIHSIGHWVLNTACQQAQLWQLPSVGRLRLAVNLSSKQLRSPNLSNSICSILDDTGFDPHLLTIELTETSLIDDLETAAQALESLKASGVEVALDDFGTGYSSLSYLSRFPIDCIKIDRSFIHRITDVTQDAEVARAIIAVAQSLKLKVIAEGVENIEQAEFLRKYGCHAIQGFIYSPALQADEIQELLLSDKRMMPMS
jgi:diguanylate cyclase (GGDEF)-like protein